MKIVDPCIEADTEACVRSMGNIQNGATLTRRDREETIVEQIFIFLFTLHTKSILVAS